MRFLLLISICFFLAVGATAQQGHVGFAARQQQLQAKARNAAMGYALAHGLPLTYVDSRGTRFLLHSIDEDNKPVYLVTLNHNAAITTNVVQLRAGGTAGLQLLGKGMTIGVFDGGRVGNHLELDNRVLVREGDQLDEHATHVTGTLIASGINPDARGMAPQGNALTYVFDNDLPKMATLAKPDQSSLLISSHSYGISVGWQREGNSWTWMGNAAVSSDEDYRAGFYSTRAQGIDSLALLSPYYTMVWAAGNDRADTGSGGHPADCNGGTGYDCIIPEGVSKNIITVGAVEPVLSYTSPASVKMSFFSSWGPTDDGRIKPDITGDGVNLFSLSSSANNAYTVLSGTSMATPNVSGSLLLLQELYKKLHGGRVMRASTLKALAIHTAREAGTAPGPDYSFGWGLLDGGAAAQHLLQENGQTRQIVEGTLHQGEVLTYALSPVAGKRIKITIAWTDVPGAPVKPSLDPTALMLVNDLDIRLTDDKARVQFPWILDPGNPVKQATTGDNFRDNVEQVLFDLPEQRPYQLTVAHKGNLTGGKQSFSLIISYESATTPTTFYWVKDAGNWSDTTHWSFTSGGASARKLPGAGDQIIVDENSFTSAGQFIAVDNDPSCRSLRWVYSGAAGINLNGHQLSVSHELTLASEQFSIPTKGRILFSGAGEINALHADISKTSLTVNSGNWSMAGTWLADSLLIRQSGLNADGANLTVNSLLANAPVTKSLSLNNAQLRVRKQMDVNPALTTVLTTAARLTVDIDTVLLNWNGLAWAGPVQLLSGKVTLVGRNSIARLVNQGHVVLSTAHHIDTLQVSAGAVLELAAQTSQSLKVVSLASTLAKPIQLSGGAGAALDFTNSTKYCFDFLNITQVQATGNGVVTAGTNSVLTSAAGWLTLACGDVLFPDFSTQYACDNSRTQFSDLSTGPITTWHWNFGDPASTDNESADRNPVHTYTRTGDFNITLTVSNGTVSQQVVRTLTIRANSILDNRIQYNATSLFSSVSVGKYAWYKDDVLLANAGRTLTYQGALGRYQVIAFDATCNRPSAPLVISGLEPQSSTFSVYPNPAHDRVSADAFATLGGHVIITNAVGQVVLQAEAGAAGIDVSSLADGLYVMTWSAGGRVYRSRLVIQHQAGILR